MILVYVDYIMVVSKNTSTSVDYLANVYFLKEGSMVTHKQYIGTNIKKVQNENGSVMLSTHSADYCKADIANLDKNLNEDGKRLSQYDYGRRPYLPSFHPEIDTSA